jgi:hypothetical protein
MNENPVSYHPRIEISLDALRPQDQEFIRQFLTSKEKLHSQMSDPKNIRKVSPTNPYRLLKITPRFEFVLSGEGDDLRIIDLVSSEVIDRYSRKKKVAQKDKSIAKQSHKVSGSKKK